VIGVEHSAVYADAHARPKELDPLAFARDELPTVLMSLFSPQCKGGIGTRLSALDERSFLVAESKSDPALRQGRRCESRSRPASPLPFQG
jgi:hypothetical protein